MNATLISPEPSKPRKHAVGLLDDVHRALRLRTLSTRLNLQAQVDSILRENLAAELVQLASTNLEVVR